jgi:DNA-binding transcriptional LysR family regulator
MRLRHIEILHAIRQAGSISGAAELLCISQPAVSKILKHAEQQLGFAIFRRAHGRLQPTDQGEALLGEVEKVYEVLDRTRRAAHFLRQGLDTHLRVVCLPSLGIGVVPAAVRLFRARHPRTTLEIACRHTQEINAALVAREFDLGIGFGPADGSERVPGIECTLLTTGGMVYVDRAARAAAAGQRAIRLAEIDQDRLIGLNSSHYLGVALRAVLDREGVAPFPAIQVQTYYIALALVAAGTGCAVIDEYTAFAPPAGVTVRPIDPPLRFGVYAYSRTQQPRSRPALAFLECVSTICADEPRATDAPPAAEAQPRTASTALTSGSI